MSTYQLIFKQYGNSGILIEWPQKISLDILNDIRVFCENIESEKFDEIVEINFIYASLLVVYKPESTRFDLLTELLKKVYKNTNSLIQKFIKNTWNIPVCYHKDYGIDLKELSVLKTLSIDEICALHRLKPYTVFGIGFLPGFLYLGGLPINLHAPRRDSPRMSVPNGAVAIGGSQTGIYPQKSPGGWHIIGQTPINLFDINREIPCEIIPGDEVQFYDVSKEEYRTLENEQRNGNYSLKPGPND